MTFWHRTVGQQPVTGWIRTGLLSVLLVCLIGGCSNTKKPGGRTGSSSTDVTGRWVLTFVEIPTEFDFCILDIDAAGKVDVKALSPMFAAAKFKSGEVKDGHVSLTFDAPQSPMNFEGQIENDVVWGTFFVPHRLLTTAKLIPTDDESFPENYQPRQVAHGEEFMKAIQSADRFAKLREFTQAAHKSPLLIEAYAGLATMLKSENYKPDEITKLLEESRAAAAPWGPRLAPKVDLLFGVSLAQQKLQPELARKLLTEAQKNITSEYPLDWTLQLAAGWLELKDAAAAKKLVQPIYAENPEQVEVAMLAAKVSEELKENDEALKIYGDLASTPGLSEALKDHPAFAHDQLPAEKFVTMWKAKHKSTDGIDKFLDQRFVERTKGFAPQREKAATPAADAKVQLLELYTGSACPPCVAVDVSTEALRMAYSPKELIVIKYHVHHPAPDPLGLEATRQRFELAEAQGTPAVDVNGKRTQQLGGGFSSAQGITPLLASMVDEELAATTPVKIKLDVERKDDQLALHVNVEGLTDFAAKPRLHLLLLENGMHFLAQNGIRIHNAVVRRDFLGARGVALNADKLTSDQTVTFTQLQADLRDEMQKSEQEFGVSFPVKPLGLKSLTAVAFVKDESGAVLQAISVEVPE